jgi:DNA polymerase III alpha subunit
LFQVEDSIEYNRSVAELHAELDLLDNYHKIDQTVEEFDNQLQHNWHMPEEYKQLDIASYVLGLCKEDYELQRVGQELLLYQERNLFDLLRYLKYLVDTLRKNNVVWGVGRGSSVASYVLFLLGVHKIDSLYYNLDIDEFLK